MVEGKKPLLWARLAVNHTKKTALVALIFPLICIAIIVGFDLFALYEPSDADYLIKGDVRTQHTHARIAALREHPFGAAVVDKERAISNSDRQFMLLLRNTRLGGKSGEFRAEHVDFNKPARNLLTPQGLAFLKEIEDAIVTSRQYTEFCQIDYKNPTGCDGRPLKCKLPTSVTNHRHLYGIYSKKNNRLCGRRRTSAPVTEENFRLFKKELQSDQNITTYSRHFAKDFKNTTFETRAILSSINFGSPVVNTAYAKTPEEKDKIFQDWAFALSTNVEKMSTAEHHIFVFSDVLIQAVFQPLVYRDLSFAGFSIVLVFAVIWAHTTSGFLASVAMLQILLSFPLTYLVYRGVFQITYYAALQIMTIFLILGIGADDVFVFTDAWKQASVVLGTNATLVDRMSWAYRRAVKAMTVTSFTTAIAFFTTAFSPIMPIGTLGVWAGLLVLLQFALVITLYPSATIIWYRFWRVRKWRNCLRAPQVDDDEASATPTEADDEINVNIEASESSTFPSGEADAPQANCSRSLFARTKAIFSSKSRSNEQEYRPLERFFNGTWTNWMHKARFPLIASSIVLVTVSIWLATRLETPVEHEKFLPASHRIVKGINVLESGFLSTDGSDNINVRITWGIKGINRAGTSRYEPDQIGKSILDENFSLRTADAQRRVRYACDFFSEESRKLLIDSDTASSKGSCWIENYLRWRRTKKLEPYFDYPSEQALVKELLEFGNHTDPRSRQQPNLHILRSGNVAFNAERSKVVFTEVSFVSNVEHGSPYAITRPMYDAWQDALKQFKENTTEPGVQRPFATAALSWPWMMSQRALVNNMYLGLGVVLAVSIVSLSVSTGNIIVSILALICIGGILTNLLALVRLVGWKLGIIESIGVVIAVGFSFDYVAHIANAYTESKSNSSIERTRDALTDLGISVVAGAISTLLAGSMLFFAVIIFFVKFGMFVVSTVLLSLIWGLVFFPSLLHTFGPVGTTGELYPLLASIWNCFRRKTNDFESGDTG